MQLSSHRSQQIQQLVKLNDLVRHMSPNPPCGINCAHENLEDPRSHSLNGNSLEHETRECLSFTVYLGKIPFLVMIYIWLINDLLIELLIKNITVYKRHL